MIRSTALVAALVLLASASALGQFCVTTTFANNNGQAGNMFDIVATNPVLINDFDCNIDSGNWTVQVYAVTGGGSWSPVSTTSSAWTLLGSASVTSAGVGNATNLGLSLGYLIPAGTTQGFYLTVTTGTGFNYTNAPTAVGTVAASDANIQVLVGSGKGSNFGSTFTPRTWNGTVCYTPGSGIFASFTVDVTAGPAPLTANFTDTSFSSAAGGASSWLWSFGDGSISTAQNPSHTYTVAGTYDVSLVVSDPTNGSDTHIEANLMTITEPLLVLATSGGGVGDVQLSGPPNPPGTSEGYLLVTYNTTLPVGGGGFFGILPDAFTFSIVGYPAVLGGVFHYIAAPNTFPNVPFLAPAGTVQLPAGTTVDAVLVRIVGNSLSATNVTRATF